MCHVRRTQPSGFTLIEILVALSVISILSVMVVIVVAPGDAARAGTEARRLAALLELARSEARASGKSIAWSPVPGGYAFWRRSEDGEWVRYPEDSVYRGRSLPGATQLRDVRVDAQALGKGERVVLSPHGFRGAFEATITSGDTRFTLRGGVFGRIALQSDSNAGANARPATTNPRLYPG